MADFPRLVQDASTRFSDYCSAYAQIRSEGNQIRVRLQATEIMRQFVGDVTWGRDPKGLLFYRTEGDFQVVDADFTYYKHGSGTMLTIQIDFREQHGDVVFARYLARVDTSKYQLPHPGQGGGSGRWTTFRAATSQTNVVRIQGSFILRLLLPPLRRRVHFRSNKMSSISSLAGILMTKNAEDLKTEVNGFKVVADVAPTRIVFHLNNPEKTEIALFIPSVPLDVNDATNIVTTWDTYHPEASMLSADFEGEEAEEAKEAPEAKEDV